MKYFLILLSFIIILSCDKKPCYNKTSVKLAWSVGVSTASKICYETILYNSKPKLVENYWEQDSINIFKIIN